MIGPVGVGAAEVLELTDDVVEMEDDAVEVLETIDDVVEREIDALLEMLEPAVEEPELVVKLLIMEPVLELVLEVVDDATVLKLDEFEHGIALQSGVYLEAS